MLNKSDFSKCYQPINMINALHDGHVFTLLMTTAAVVSEF